MSSKIRRIRLKKSASLLSAGLVISAMVGGLYGDRLHFVFALGAVGMVQLCIAWFTYLKLTGSFRWMKKRAKPRVPYFLRREKDTTRRKPAFLRNSAEFDDDLNAATSTDESELSERERSMNGIFAHAVSGIVLLILSCIIKM